MRNPSFKYFLGIDLAKAKFTVCLLGLESPKPVDRGEFTNNPAGFERLKAFLAAHVQHLSKLLCVLEATGNYGRALEQYLFGQRLAYTSVNPAQIKYHARSRLSRTKTDAADARMIASYGRERAADLLLSAPLTPAQRQLQALIREMEALIDQRTATKNRRSACELPCLQEKIQEQINFLTQQINTLEATALQLVKANPDLAHKLRLLCSIKGIATRTALRVLAEIAGKQFQAARQLAAYAGLTPSEHQSGTSVRGKTRLCKTGNARLRTALYLPAQTARRHCLPLTLWADTLASRGLKPKAVIGAVMRKLAHIIFGVLKHDQPFDEDKIPIPAA